MYEKQKYILLLTLLIALLFIVNYQFLDEYLIKTFEEPQTVFVDRVIDGDTIKSDELSIRLLGINAPEKNEMYSDEARIFLEKLVFNKTIKIEFGKDRYDKYGRLLAYVFVIENTEKIHVNLELVKNGFANPYFPSGKDRYYSDFMIAWQECIDSEKNLCEPSNDSCAGCFEITTNVLKNICDYNCSISDWSIKPQGRDKFEFKDRVLQPNEYVLFEIELNDIGFGTGDTLYLRDSEEKLVLWKEI